MVHTCPLTLSLPQGEGIMPHTSTYATAIGLPGEPVAPLSRSGLKI